MLLTVYGYLILIFSLQGLFESPDFLSVSSLASDVLSSMKMSPSFSTGEPSPSALELLNNIQSADPHSDLYSEDDHGASWGHAQYTSGSLTLTTVLLSWASLGSVDTALRFIAAGAQTVKMAKHICFVDNLPDSSPLALYYLQNTLELIWSHWKAAGGVSRCLFEQLSITHNLLACFQGKVICFSNSSFFFSLNSLFYKPIFCISSGPRGT